MTVDDDQKPRHILREWQKSAIETSKRLGKVAWAVTTSPAVLFGLGVCAWSHQVSGEIGFWANVGVTALSAGTCAFENWTGEVKGKPYFVRAVANAVTIYSTISHGIHNGNFDVHSMHEIMQPIKAVVLPAASSFLAGISNVAQGIHERRHTKPKGTFDDPMFYAGLCDPPAVVGIHGMSMKLLAPFIAGIAKSLIKKSAVPEDVESWRDLVFKHVTPAKLYALGWGIGAVVIKDSSPVLAVAETLWLDAFALWDKQENQELLPDIKRLMKKSTFQPVP